MKNVIATHNEFGFIFILIISKYENNFKAHIGTIRFHYYEWMRWMGFINSLIIFSPFTVNTIYLLPHIMNLLELQRKKYSWHGNLMDMTNDSIRSCNIAQVAKGEEVRNIQTEAAEGKHLESKVLQGQHCLGSSIDSGRLEASDKVY